MANLYLMQALYAPKPPLRTPTPEASAIDGGEMRQPRKSATPEQLIHDARRKLMESEEQPEPESKVAVRWKPTGANVQPVRIKDEFPHSDAAETFLESLPSFPGNIAATPSSPLPMRLPAGLMYPIERYLPPAGLYYDQNSLIPIFGAVFFKYAPCMICWTCHPAAGYSTTSCGKVCKVCRTRRHPDEAYYKDKSRPKAMTRNMFEEDKPRRSTKPSQAGHSRSGPSLVDTAPPQQPLPAPMTYTMPMTLVDRTLDPRLQGRSSLSAPTRSTATQPDVTTENKDVPDNEKKLQEQEVEILNLRMQAVVKDREIRKLRAELEQLHAQAANSGGAY
ncbi:hypothetical protein J4E93_000995 [Alternaria ventricosa]|uniref:uncharacterized protein n=1 Tax=Alternaria ventricosa TaxID=1187951 RepID=UPI0020C42D03|nr:uncharacterized protein J4E93_000995 [Alternaria ventricosa]KAI4656276.1 hypothetical protein J4E93_000995 [Alternaria ventricosa]